MQDSFQPQPPSGPYGGYDPEPRRGSRLWLWLLLGVAAVVILLCGGCLAFLMYVGTYAPETSVYAGNEVPNQFIETMKSLGALDDDETILYFYSDALTDIRDGFCFVSENRVVVYSEAAGGSPLSVVRFDEIADLTLDRNESFFIDSQITLELKNGRPVSFPVSSETGGDQRFFEAIQTRVEGPSEPPEESDDQ